MPKPSAHEHETPVNTKPAYIPCTCNHPGKFLPRFHRQHLISIKNENPFVPKRKILESPVLFLRPRPAEMELHNLSAMFRRDIDRPICALRINHEDFIRPCDRT